MNETLNYNDLIEQLFKDREIDQIDYTYRKDYYERVIYIDFDLSVDTITNYTRLILDFNRQDIGIPRDQRKPIKIYIFSYGGDIAATLHFIDICNISETPIYTYNMGVAMSGGLHILLAGNKRYALKNSEVLIHQGSASNSGTAEQVQSVAKQYAKILKILDNNILKNTKITEKMLSKNKTKEWYILADEQVELGIVDKIIDNIEEVL